MAIAHALTDTTGDLASPASPVTITKPTGANSTHRLVLIFGSGNNNDGNGPKDFTPPSGWTSAGAQVVGTNGSRKVGVHLFHAAGDVANLDFTLTGTGATYFIGWICAAFTGVDTSTPIDVFGTGNSANNVGSLAMNDFSTVTDNAWAMFGVSEWNGGNDTATGYTISANAGAQQSAVLGYNTTPKSPAGAVGSVTVNCDGSTTNQIIVGQPFALRPAAAAQATAAFWFLKG